MAWNVAVEYPFATYRMPTVDSSGLGGVHLQQIEQLEDAIMVRLHLDTVTAERAVGMAARWLARTGGLHGAVPDTVTVSRPGRPDRVPELVGLAEVAAVLNVSKQRVTQLVARIDFPEPVARLAMGPVWTRTAIDEFHTNWQTRRRNRVVVDVIPAPRPRAPITPHVYLLEDLLRCRECDQPMQGGTWRRVPKYRCLTCNYHFDAELLEYEALAACTRTPPAGAPERRDLLLASIRRLQVREKPFGVEITSRLPAALP